MAMSGGIRGGAKLARHLKKIQEALARKQTVAVGFFEEATYPDGTPVAEVAATQEFGAVIDVPEHDTTIYRSINKDGSFRRDGRFVKAARSNFATDHKVAAHKVIIPARPFLRPAIEAGKAKWVKAAEAVLKMNDYKPKAALEAMGTAAASDVRKQIAELTEPPLADATIAAKRRKGSKRPEKPLIDTGHMAQSVRWQVSDD